MAGSSMAAWGSVSSWKDIVVARCDSGETHSFGMALARERQSSHLVIRISTSKG
jgi:hypothetical protein